MAIEKHSTPMLDQLETGPWPSFISGIKCLRDQHLDPRINNMSNSLLGQLDHSYETRKGYWKGGTVSLLGYGGGIIPRFSEVAWAFSESKEFHTLRVKPPASNHYTTAMLRQLAGSWEKYGFGLITFYGQTGNIMFIGAETQNTQPFFDEINAYGWDLGRASPCVRTAMSCVGAARCEMSCTNELRGLDHNSAYLVQSRRRRSLAEHGIARANPHGPAGLGRICDQGRADGPSHAGQPVRR